MIFVDTSFWVAVRNRRDEHHPTARALLTRFATEHLVTTNHVRGETWTFLARRSGHAAAASFVDALAHSPRVEVRFVSEDQEAESLRWLRRHDERPYSFVDATSFVVMRALHLRRALTLDADFTFAGFQPVHL